MKSQNSKKPNLKIALDRKSVASLPKTEKPPSSKCSQKTISSNGKTSASSNKISFKFQETFSTPNPSLVQSEGDKKSISFMPDCNEPYEDKSQLIQFLIHENLQLQKQNSDKDSIINKLLTSSTRKSINLHRANTSNTERNIDKYKTVVNKPMMILESQKQESQKNCTPLGFTFCNTEEEGQERGIPSQPSTKSCKRLPKEFQIVPNQRRFFI